MRWSSAAGALLLLAAGLAAQASSASLATAQPASPTTAERELTVGVFDAPPYSFKSPTGEWRGFSVELWRQIADELGLRYRLVEGTEDEILESLANKRLDLSAGPIAITMDRERLLDFTESYLTSGLSIAVRKRGRLERMAALFHGLAESGAAHIIGAVILLSGLFGAGVWLVERRHNPMFPTRPAPGIGSGLWFAGTTTSGVGYGDKVPITLAGRLLAAFWMLISVLLMLLVTASLTATLAIGEFQQVRDLESLRRARVGVLAGSAAADFLRHNQIPHRLLPSYPKVIEALLAKRVDAVILNEEILRYYTDRAVGTGLQVLPPLFMPENFGFALTDASTLRPLLDRGLHRALASTRYRDLKDQYLYGDAIASAP
ncbi:MAG TPA: transporter substrate-binding domain-containing protein [Thermoanaerobaculia bacterium]